MRKSLLFVMILVCSFFLTNLVYAEDMSRWEKDVKSADSLTEFDAFFQTLLKEGIDISKTANSIFNLRIVTQSKIQNSDAVKKGLSVVAGISFKF